MVGLPDTTEERRKPQHALMCIYILLLSNLAALNVYFSFNKKKKKGLHSSCSITLPQKLCECRGIMSDLLQGRREKMIFALLQEP